MRIDFQGIPIELLSEKAVYLPVSRSLVISDVHIGKTLDMQRAGIRVPSRTASGNEEKIQNLLHRHRPRNCYFLGDLFHHKHNSEFEIIKRIILKNRHMDFVLIKGNHEILSDESYQNLGLEVVDKIQVEGITVRHHPSIDSMAPSLSGHIHPKVRLSGRGREVIARPVFAIRGYCMILPAFGALTGGHKIDPKEYREIYVVGNEEVIRMK